MCNKMELMIKILDFLLKYSSLLAIALSIWALYRTRRKARWGIVKTSCAYESNLSKESRGTVQTGPASLLVEISNLGPEEINILSLRGKYRDGSKNSISLRDLNTKLGVSERLERAIMPFDEVGGAYDGFRNENGAELVNLWFEDTYGRKHKLRSVKKYLRKMRKNE